MTRVLLCAGIAVVVPLAFVVVTSALMWATVARIAAAAVRAFGRANQWSPQ